MPVRIEVIEEYIRLDYHASDGACYSAPSSLQGTHCIISISRTTCGPIQTYHSYLQFYISYNI